MAIHSSILAWRIPLTEEPEGLHSPWGSKELHTTEGLTLSLREKRAKNQIHKIIGERGDITTETTKIQRIMRLL